MIPDNTILHLAHSSNLMKIFNRVFIFDYAGPENLRMNGSRKSEVLDPESLRDEDVTVFSSHGHRDHFDPVILSWRHSIKKIRYVISNDISGLPDFVSQISPGETQELRDLRVAAYHSTDRGVAFSLFLNNVHIYFAGDHALWSRTSESDDQRYVRLLKMQLRDTPPIDIAFHVCDPRLSGKGAGGIYTFAREFQPEIMIPLHSFGVYKFNKKAHRELNRQKYGGFFWQIQSPGETLDLTRCLDAAVLASAP